MRFRKPTHPITADVRREISCFALSKAGGFKRPMRFPFQHIETDRDHIRIFTPGNRARPPQIIPVVWQRITYGWKPYFVCPRCHTRRWFLYFDGLQAYCRKCADLRFLSQRIRRRTRLLHRRTVSAYRSATSSANPATNFRRGRIGRKPATTKRQLHDYVTSNVNTSTSLLQIVVMLVVSVTS